MWCRDGTRAIRDPVVSDIPVTYVTQNKGKNKGKGKKARTTVWSPPSLLLVPSGVDSTSISTSVSTSSCWVARVSSSGASGASALFSRRGDFHPHASWRASLLAAQASARASCGPLQLAHWVVTCVHPWPRPVLYPSTEHWWSCVVWSFAQMAHLGVSKQ